LEIRPTKKLQDRSSAQDQKEHAKGHGGVPWPFVLRARHCAACVAKGFGGARYSSWWRSNATATETADCLARSGMVQPAGQQGNTPPGKESCWAAPWRQRACWGSLSWSSLPGLPWALPCRQLLVIATLQLVSCNALQCRAAGVPATMQRCNDALPLPRRTCPASGSNSPVTRSRPAETKPASVTLL
jgi:hypothetical protein